MYHLKVLSSIMLCESKNVIKTSNMTKSLETIIKPMNRSEFLDHYLNNKPVVIHGLLDELSELTALPFLKSLDSLLEAWPTFVTAYMEGIASTLRSLIIRLQGGQDPLLIKIFLVMSLKMILMNLEDIFAQLVVP